ncbi:MAG: leucine-rich repeat protein, partial [Muribaculaceae bacterium]|nr:leucine-rich repeat protein [Muribaculaceae bacterium]
ITESSSSGLGGSNVYHHIYGKDLAGAFYQNQSFEKVILPKSLDNIGDYLFSEGSVKEISMSPNSRRIGKWAFRRCKELEIVTLPENLETIGEEAFSETSIKEVELPSSVKEIKSQAFEYSKLELINLENVEILGEGAFSGVKELKGELNLSKIEVIPNRCFNGTKISSPILSQKLKSVGDYGFSSCVNIEKIVLGESLEEIGNYTFSSCSKLTDVELPSTIRQIGAGAFSETPWGKSLVSEDGIIYIGNIAYSYDGSYNHEGTELTIKEGTVAISNGFSFTDNIKEKITSLNLPESLIEIGNEAFIGFKELGEVKLPSSLQKIGNGAFRYCPKFWCVLPESLVSLGERAFEECGTLSKVTLPENLRSIGGGVFNETSVGTVYIKSTELDLIACRYVYTDAYSPFEKCETLSKVVVSPNVRKLCDKMFTYGSSIRTVEFEDIDNCMLEYVGTECFGGCDNAKFKDLPKTIKHIGEGAFSRCNFENNFNIDNVRYLGKYAFSSCTGFDSVRIPECVDTLGGVVFSGCKDLRSVEFNAKEFVGLMYSVNYAGGGGFSAEAAKLFEYCDSIERVSIGSKVKFLPYAIFGDCRNIKELKFESRENEIDKTISIGDYAFSWCTGITEIELPEGVDSIGKEAFNFTNIKSIKIPSSCRFIGTNALSSREGMESVFFYPTIPPTIEESLGAYNYDGDLTIYVPKDSYDLYMKVPELEGYVIKKMANGGIAVESITLNPESWEGAEGSVFNIKATVYPEEATEKSVSWTSSDESIAKVDNEGNVTTMKAGEAIITATALDGSYVAAECKVKVNIVPVESIVFNLTDWKGVIGSTVQIEATVNPENASDKTLIWISSDESIATVDDTGKVTAIKVGEADITANAKDGTEISATCHITVLPVLVESIKVEPENWHAVVGESLQISASVYPENATDKTIKWTTSDDAIVKVSEEGYVSALKVGEADITAMSSDGSEVSAVCHVIVYPISVESIQLNPVTWEGVVGETIQIDAAVYPENATDRKLIWLSSDESVASVNGSGFVYALKEGEADIIAKASDGSGVTAICHVKVTSIAVETVSLNPESWTGRVGDTFQIKASIVPDNASVKNLAWKSQDDSIATVDSDVNVTLKGVGETDIIAMTTDGSNVSATCHVTVLPAAAEYIILTPDSWEGKEGDSFQLRVSVYPENSTINPLVWKSSDESVAKVDSEGYVTAIHVGETVITVSTSDESELKAVCNVTVLPVLIESIYLDPDAWNGEEGETFQIMAYISPENATNKTLIWQTNDESVAKVDSEGVVTVYKEGNCVITVSSTDGSNVSSECKISSVAGVETLLLDDDVNIDIYNMKGILIKKNCTKEYLKRLTPDIYLIRIGDKIKSVVIR